MTTHSSILARISHGQRSLAPYSPWGCKELDLTDHTLVLSNRPLLKENVFFIFVTIDKQMVFTKYSLNTLLV